MCHNLVLHSFPTRRSSDLVLASIAVIFLVVFLFLRVGFVEPFGVPTGSMAPTLIGNHREGPCPRCGYPVRVGLRSEEHTSELQSRFDLVCRLLLEKK